MFEPFLKQTDTLTELPDGKIGFYDPRFTLEPFPVEFELIKKNGILWVSIPDIVLHPKHVPQFVELLNRAVSEAAVMNSRIKST